MMTTLKGFCYHLQPAVEGSAFCNLYRMFWAELMHRSVLGDSEHITPVSRETLPPAQLAPSAWY